MGRSRRDGALWARIAQRGGTEPSEAGTDAAYLIVDPTSGALVVTGAGAAANATALRVQDGDTTRTATVGEDRALRVRDVTREAAQNDAANFPTAPLAAGETFTGVWVDVHAYAAISVVIFTDQPSATNGAVVEFSTDAVNVARSVSTTIPANVGSYFALAPEARYYRLRYTNGATAQTVLRGQAILRFQPPAIVEQPLGATINDQNLGQISRAAVSGRLPDGRYLPVAVTADQRLLVDVELAQPLTAAELDARTVAVSGPLTDAQLAARGLSTEATLAAALAELRELTYNAAGRLRVESVEPPFRASYAAVSVPASTWTTIVDATPAADYSVLGYNADVASLTNITYRQRLVRLDAAGAVVETYHVSTAQSASVAWVPLAVTLTAGQRIALQAFHGELAAQTFDGTVNWRER